ncbi:MAG: tetratricopeptide repeat protein [Puniceicoccales bacterium]|jgi:tetratricopeptide (TPR) repeat protein|nr:tetratricopeptide repeat protein [Puniceicoccales bacterium]
MASVCGEQSAWEEQVEAIKKLAETGYLDESEKAGQVLLDNIVLRDGVGGERARLLELLGGFSMKGGRHRRAADYYLRARGDAPDPAETNRYLVLAADAYYSNGDYSLATALYLERQHLAADEEILFRYGCALLHGGSWDEAEQLTFQSERIRAKFDWNRAAYWYKKNDFEKACRYLEPWLGDRTLGLAAHYFYAQMRYRLGDCDGATRAIELGLRYYGERPGDGDYERLLCLQLRIALERDDPITAAAVERTLRALGDGHLGAMLLAKATGLRRAGKVAEALVALDELERHLPGEARYLRGEIFFEGGGVERALEVFKELGKMEGRMGYIGRLRQADLEHRLGNFSHAEGIYVELQRGVGSMGWMEGKETVFEYMGAKIGRSRRAQGYGE